MFCKTSVLVLSLMGLATILAAPMQYRLEDIQCRCISFSTSAKPTLCTYLESHGLDWQTAYTLATENGLRIQFASQTTISKFLSISKPLPSSVLRSLGQGEALPLTSTELMQSQNKMVCGLGDEVKYMSSRETSLEPELHCVGIFIASFMILLVFYVVGEYVWTRYMTEGSIKLEGDEKTLTAEFVASITTRLDPLVCTAPADYS
ncbi:hypothetical protein EJ02DRAFT_339688 [Clathrospora elynae]|uniref:Uncharacterized protein n=1 Tax=Clathrospora elynae TaxID=706981 RepID=A0A6A5SX99_9PLEO|nr:hypothetical protein EJ02DRAFT_339688 [Clathrospora elynae]